MKHLVSAYLLATLVSASPYLSGNETQCSDPWECPHEWAMQVIIMIIFMEMTMMLLMTAMMKCPAPASAPV